MYNYKQILEAINRGIKFALADLEDDEKLSSISKQKQGQIEDELYGASIIQELILISYLKLKTGMVDIMHGVNQKLINLNLVGIIIHLEKIITN